MQAAGDAAPNKAREIVLQKFNGISLAEALETQGDERQKRSMGGNVSHDSYPGAKSYSEDTGVDSRIY